MTALPLQFVAEYVNGTLMYHVLDNADFYLSAQYMPLGNASFSSGGRHAELNLVSQIYVSLGINWPFSLSQTSAGFNG